MRAVAIWVACALAVAAAGCGGSSSDREAGGVHLVTHKGGDAPAAFVAGRVVFDRDKGCVRLGEQAAIWPSGSSLEESPLGLSLPNGEVVSDGDRIRGAGGEIPANRQHLRRLVDGDIEAVMRCATDGTVVLVAQATRNA